MSRPTSLVNIEPISLVFKYFKIFLSWWYNSICNNNLIFYCCRWVELKILITAWILNSPNPFLSTTFSKKSRNWGSLFMTLTTGHHRWTMMISSDKSNALSERYRKFNSSNVIVSFFRPDLFPPHFCLIIDGITWLSFIHKGSNKTSPNFIVVVYHACDSILHT